MTEIRHIGIWSAAKVSAAVMMVIGLCAAILFLILMLPAGGAAGGAGIFGGIEIELEG